MLRKLSILPLLLILSACATDQFARRENTARLVTQYAVLKYAEQIPTAQREARIERIRAIATDVKGLAAGETTLELLRTAVNAQLDKSGLSPADRLLADGLVQILAAELAARIGNGVLAPDQLVQVNAVLDWVIQATELV